jgi:hypothetical protein
MSNHRYGDERIVEYLQEPKSWNYPRDLPYHPRSNKHGGLQCRYFVDDLLHESAEIRAAAEAGKIVVAEDYDVGEGGLSWNTDLVIGPPSEGNVQTALDGEYGIPEGDPEEVWLAGDAKSIMTEHGKARNNRVRDINSFADIMHHHHEQSIGVGILMVNISKKFDSPLRDPDDITDHGDLTEMVEEIVEMFDSIDRSEGDVSANLDGAGVVVVDCTNFPEEAEDSRLVTEEPAPQLGERVHYRTFVEQTAELFERRFL